MPVAQVVGVHHVANMLLRLETNSALHCVSVQRAPHRQLGNPAVHCLSSSGFACYHYAAGVEAPGHVCTP